MSSLSSRRRVPAAVTVPWAVVQRCLFPALLGIVLLLPGIANAQQGQCFKDSNGREVCCDANGNCR
jgi:hypothetical protein